MPIIDLSISRHLALDSAQFRYWDNENPNSTRKGLSWSTAWRDGEGTVGDGHVSFFKATDTPYRMELNRNLMSNDTFFCDCTGVGFERSNKKSDFRASSTFTFTVYDAPNNIHSTSVTDLYTGVRSGGLSGFNYDGHLLFSDTLNYEGAWGVWHVEKIGDVETVIPLTRVLDYNDLDNGNWYWDSDVLYIKWDGVFQQSQFEIIQRAKAFELWTDEVPTDGRKSAIYGIRSRFGLFGHHNANCQGWRIADSELAWNAIDGFAMISQNINAKTYGLYTQIYRCEVHHNYRDGITNYVTPAGAAAHGNGAYYDLCADMNYIHDNGGAGIFIHRMLRQWATDNLQSSSYPFRITGNTITNNGRGIAITDERMNDVIPTFGYDFVTIDTWESYTYQDKVDYWDGLQPGFDEAWVKLRNNNIYGNTTDATLTSNTWPGTVFNVDSDYNNFGDTTPWVEGENSLSVDPQFTTEPIINSNSPLVSAGETPFTYPLNTETTLYYYTPDADPLEWDVVDSYNIGSSSIGPAYADLEILRHMPSFTIQTKSFQIPTGDQYILLASTNTLIETSIPYAEGQNVVSIEILQPSISGFYHSKTESIVEISGTASSLIGTISSVSWFDNKGNSGIATGTENWSFDFNFSQGSTSITVVATNEYQDINSTNIDLFISGMSIVDVDINTARNIIGYANFDISRNIQGYLELDISRNIEGFARFSTSRNINVALSVETPSIRTSVIDFENRTSIILS